MHVRMMKALHNTFYRKAAINIGVLAHTKAWLSIIVNSENMGNVVLNKYSGVILTGEREKQLQHNQSGSIAHPKHRRGGMYKLSSCINTTGTLTLQ